MSRSELLKKPGGQNLEVVSTSADSSTGNENEQKLPHSSSPKRGAQCLGDKCKRYWDIYGDRKWAFIKIDNPALSDTSAMKSPVMSSNYFDGRCMLCGTADDSPKGGWEFDNLSRRPSCCPKPACCGKLMKYRKRPCCGKLKRCTPCCGKLMKYCKHSCCGKLMKYCKSLCCGKLMKYCKSPCCGKLMNYCRPYCGKLKKCCRVGVPEIDHYRPGVRKLNPIWTGEDPDQIGIFIRNLTVLGINENLKTISVQFYLNIVWLDKGFCDYTRKRNEGIHEALGDKWYVQLRTEDYERRYKEYLMDKKVGKSDWQEVLKGTQQRAPEKQYNKLPNIVIWNITDEGCKAIEDLVSVNKQHIGKDTVYWRRLIRASLHVDFHSHSFPFGYESFRLKIRLLSWTGQHLVLLRTKLWREKHLELLNGSLECHRQKDENMSDAEYDKQMDRNKLLADYSFSYIHPDNSRIPEWKVCSVHGSEDQWISPFDNNDLEFRLPVRVTRGMDTQSSFEAMIVLKHLPHSVLLTSWFWFSLSTILALLTYQLDPDEWEGRLAIAVAVIFVQMNLRNHSSQHYPRVGKWTVLDIHISLNILYVILQAFVQCLMRYINFENLSHWDHIAGWINCSIVVLTNCATLPLAKYMQRYERLKVESMVRWFTGFNQEPLGEHNGEDIEQTVKVKGRECGVRLQVYDEVLNKIIDGRGRMMSSTTSEYNSTRTMYRLR